MRRLVLATAFAGAVVVHLTCVASHVLSFTTVTPPGWLSAFVPGLFAALVGALWGLDLVVGRSGPVAAARPPAPPWVRRVTWGVIAYGMVLGPYMVVNFFLTMHRHPGKRKPAFAEVRLITGHAMFFSYAAALVSGVAWAGRRWSDPPAAGTASPG